MYTNIIFSVFGHDRRQFAIARSLVKMGHTVRLCCAGEIPEKVSCCEVFLDWKQALLGCDVIILPLPVSRDSITLCYTDEQVYIKDIVQCATKLGCKYIIGGKFPDDMASFAADEINIDDYYKTEALQMKNALPSAEGALMLAMEHTDKIIEGMSVLISGYGRIGSRLAGIMHKLGADVTVAARRDESLFEAAQKGYNTLRINSDINTCDVSIQPFDVIFNTVPHRIFTKNAVSTIKGNPIYIEIASAPYGIDLVAAREQGIEVILAPSIPAKYAPETAGQYILEAISDILRKRGMSI